MKAAEGEEGERKSTTTNCQRVRGEEEGYVANVLHTDWTRVSYIASIATPPRGMGGMRGNGSISRSKGGGPSLGSVLLGSR